MTNFSLRARTLAGLALTLALAGVLVPATVDAAATVDGQFAELGMSGAGVTTSLVVANRGGVPGNAIAVTLNVTATGSLGGGFATVYPCGTPRPNTSNINFVPGSTVANAVTTKVGAGGAVCLYTDAPTHLIVDVNGYYPPTANFGALEPARLLDTRNSAIPGAGATTSLVVANRGGVPGNATAVTLNVTSTGSLGGGFATVYPCGTPRPNTSNINFAAGSTVANAVTSKVGADGAVCLYTDAATHLIVDVNGYYSPTANFGALEPARLLDTRNSAIPGAGATTSLVVANRGGVPGNATAVTLNVTSTGSLGGGFATVYPCGTPRPNTSNINFAAGSTVANAVTTKVGADGAVCLYTDAATHLIVDVNGYYPPTANFGALEPARLLDTRRSSPIAAAEDAALTLLNQLRASRGLGPVSPDATMTAFARNWSLTMAQSGFRHSGGPYAENIGWTSDGSLSPEAAAFGLHGAFVASPPHLANMTNPAWTAVGVGVHYDGGAWYITLEFR